MLAEPSQVPDARAQHRAALRALQDAVDATLEPGDKEVKRERLRRAMQREREAYEQTKAEPALAAAHEERPRSADRIPSVVRWLIGAHGASTVRRR